jgi:hypothetical protein
MSRSFLYILKKISNYPNRLRKEEIIKTQHLGACLEVSKIASLVVYSAYC